MSTSPNRPDRQRPRDPEGKYTPYSRSEASITLHLSEWHQLAVSPEAQDRRRAAMKTEDVVLLQQLAADPEPRVRQGAASNPAANHELLLTLSTDSDSGVAETAQMSLGDESDPDYRRRSRDFAYGLENLPDTPHTPAPAP